jgi:hypothetical protein
MNRSIAQHQEAVQRCCDERPDSLDRQARATCK